jgi:hypothetical protein
MRDTNEPSIYIKRYHANQSLVEAASFTRQEPSPQKKDAWILLSPDFDSYLFLSTTTMYVFTVSTPAVPHPTCGIPHRHRQGIPERSGLQGCCVSFLQAFQLMLGSGMISDDVFGRLSWKRTNRRVARELLIAGAHVRGRNKQRSEELMQGTLAYSPIWNLATRP